MPRTRRANFLPSTGRLVQFRPPAERDGAVRVDTGVYEGGEVSMHYDSMIAKLIAPRHEPRRGADAARRGARCLRGPRPGDEHRVPGGGRAPSALRGRDRSTPASSPRSSPAGYAPAAAPIEDPSLFVGVAAAVHWRYAERSAKIAGQVRGHERDVGDARVVHLRGEAYPVRVRSDPGRPGSVPRAATPFAVQSDWKLGEPLFHRHA